MCFEIYPNCINSFTNLHIKCESIEHMNVLLDFNVNECYNILVMVCLFYYFYEY